MSKSKNRYYYDDEEYENFAYLSKMKEKRREKKRKNALRSKNLDVLIRQQEEE